MAAAQFGIAAAALDLASFPPYIWQILTRRARPERAGWTMYGIEYSYLALAQWSAGAAWSNGIAVTEALGCATIAALSWRYGRDDLSRQAGDSPLVIVRKNLGTVACFAFLAAAMIAWPWAPPALRVVLAVAVDLLATSMVVRSAWRSGGESVISWAMYGASGLLAIGATGVAWPDILYLYPVAAACFGAAVLVATWAGRGNREDQPGVDTGNYEAGLTGQLRER